MHTTKVREAWQRSKRFKNVFISEASKVTMPPPVPGAPAPPLVRDVSDTTARLSWADESGVSAAAAARGVAGAEVTFQLLARRQGGTAPFSVCYKGTSLETTVGAHGTPFSMQADTAYIFRLVAANAFGTSERGAPCVVTTLVDPFLEEEGAGGRGRGGIGEGGWGGAFCSASPASLAQLPAGWTEHFDPASSQVLTD